MASNTEISNTKKFLDYLSEAEGADYNVIVGGSRFNDYSKHPGIVGLRTKEGPSTAAGRYQITKTTYNDFAPKLGITDFSPESQDRIALAIIAQSGALDDVRQGNFKKAIDKLGGRWASLPSSPYSQPKKSWEWTQQRLGSLEPQVVAAEAPPVQNTLKNPQDAAPTTSVGMTDLAASSMKREEKDGGFINSMANLPEAVKLGFQNENYIYNILKEEAVGQADPNLVITKELGDSATKDIPTDYHEYILSGINQEDIFRKRARVEEAMKRQQRLSEMGAVGIVGTISGALFDLPTAVSFVPVVGGAAAISRTSRIANAVASGLAAGVTNVAVEAALQKYRPTATTDELYFAGAAGLGFGAISGALIKPGSIGRLAGTLGAEIEALENWAAKQARSIQVKELNEAGLEVTELGKKVLDPDGSITAKSVDPVTDAVRKEDAEVPTHVVVSSSVDWVPRLPNGQPRTPTSSMKKMLDELANDSDPELSLFAKRFKEVTNSWQDVPVYTVPKKDLNRGKWAGVYYHNPHIIALGKDSSKAVKLHEVAHAVTVMKLDFGKARPETIHGKLTSDIQAAYDLAKAEADKAGFKSYYLQDIYEFTAGIYAGTTRKDFKAFLSNIKVDDGDNLLSKLIDSLRKILGLDPKETNLWLKSLDLTDRLIEQKLNVKLAQRVNNDLVKLPRNLTMEMSGEQGANVAYSKYGAGLENFFARDWVPQQARDLFGKLAGTTQGYKNHAVVQQSAWDQTVALSGGWQTRLVKAYQPAFNEFFKESGAKRLEKYKVFESWERQVGDYIRGVEGEYHPTVRKAGDAIRPILRDAVDHINNPGKFNGAVKRGLTQEEYLDEMGMTQLTKALDYNDNYVPRQFDVPKLKQMVSQFGRETVEGYFERAFKRVNPDVDDRAAKNFGKWYIDSLEDAKINRSADFIDDMLKGYDKEALKESLMRVGKMSDPDAQDLIDAMFPKSVDRGAMTRNLRKRSIIDEMYTEEIQMPDGTNYTMTLNDFVDTRTFDVLNGYFTRTAGAVSLANNVGVYKSSDINKAILDATTAGFMTNMNESQLTSLRKNLQFTFDRLLSRPVENFTPLNKALETWRGFNVTRLMSMAVFNQVIEQSQIIGMMGWKTTLKAIPQLNKMFRDAQTGKVANDVLEHLENVTGGAGADILRRTDFSLRDDWVREVGDTQFNRWLDRVDNVAVRSADAVLKYSGMTGLMVQQKRIHAIAVVNHFLEVANGSKKMVFNAERLAWMGLDGSSVERILANMKQFQTAPKGKNRLGSVDFDAWNAADPESYAKFIVAFQRESRRVVQENDLASMVPIMGTSIGQTLFQFMNFSLQGWNKSLLFAMNHKDFATLSTVLHGSVFASISYMARTNLQMMGMSPEERREFAQRRLSNQQIVANSFGRIAQVSLLPVLIDSTIAPTPIFSGARTTSNVTDFLGSNPTMSSLSTLLTFPRRMTRNALSDEYQTTEKDMQQYFRLLPMNNAIGISQFLNSIAADYPSQETQE
jgi:muramidase (phage lysozyme)